jgi:hypothetical protein
MYVQPFAPYLRLRMQSWVELSLFVLQRMDRICPIFPCAHARKIFSSLLPQCLFLIQGIISGRLIDLGHLHIPLGIASATQVVAVFLAAECKEYWQFLLCQGFLVGVYSSFASGL